MKNNMRFIGPRRRLLQWATILILLLLPWLEIDGKSLLRIDFHGLNIFLFGQVLRIQELYLVMLAALIFALGFLLVTVVLGRVWCGWFCPQTTLTDLAEWAARRLGLKVKHNRLHGALWRQVVLQVFFLALAFLVAANLLWYFIPPRLFFAGLVTFDLHYAAWLALVIIGLLVYVDLALVRRLMCREFCPYGRIQTAIVDKATLSLHLPDSELERCIECNLCRRSCPMEIDIRQGYQVECTNCGRCLDACRQVMMRRKEPGLIRYTFGLHGEGIKGLLNLRVFLPALAVIAFSVLLWVDMVDRPVASLKVSVSHTAAPRKLADGKIGTFFNAWVNNRSQAKTVYTLQARNKETGVVLILKGQVQAALAAGKNRRLDFVLLTLPGQAYTVEFVLKNEAGQELSIAEAYISERLKTEGGEGNSF